MSGRECRQASEWLAAFEAGQLDEAGRLRLQDHLETCTVCSASSRGMSRIVRLLREDQPALGEARRRNLRQAIERGLGETPAPAPRGRGRLAWILAGAAALLVAAGTWFLLGQRPADPRARVEDPRPPARAGWEVVEGHATSATASYRSGGRLPPRGELRLERETRLAFRGVRVEARRGSRLELAGGAVIRLHEGRVVVNGGDPALVVLVANLRVRPVGTIFSVAWDGRGSPRIEVANGRVEVRSPERAVVLEAGASFGGGAAAGGSRPASQPASPGLQAELRGIESLIAAGRTVAARSRSRALLARAPGRAASQSIRILIAESLVRDQDYLGARHAYLLAWREAPGTLLGGSALYTAASLELERLGHAAEAARRLRLYLASYPKGSQREGSYYLLHRSLVRLGRTEEARQVADAYRREFPAGRYVLPDRP